MMARSKSYQEGLIEALKDPREAAEYLNAAIEEGHRELFLLALRNVAEARLGGMAQLAEQAGLNRESLYRMLSEQGNPALSSLDKLLHALGLRLSIEVDTTKVA
jgi:probable addiction module antidote protein